MKIIATSKFWLCTARFLVVFMFAMVYLTPPLLLAPPQNLSLQQEIQLDLVFQHRVLKIMYFCSILILTLNLILQLITYSNNRLYTYVYFVQ